MVVTNGEGHRVKLVQYGVHNRDVFIPLSVYCSMLNLDTDYTEREKPMLYPKDMSTVIELKVGSDEASVNGECFELPYRVYDNDGMVMIPTRAISSQLGYTVEDTYDRIHLAKK